MKNFFIISFLFFGCGLYSQTSADRSLKVDETGNFITYTSPYYALSCVKNTSDIAYFSIESGGRSRRLIDKTLLRPGILSGVVGDGNKDKISIRSIDERSFEINVKGANGITGEFYKISTAPDISPVTVWALPSTQPPSEQYDRPVTFYKPKIRKASHQLPAILHFPDYGLVKIEASVGQIYMQEHMVPDDTNAGLTYGPFNRGSHTGFRAIHKGAVVLSFHAEKEVSDAKITFTVLDENYPKIDGCDFSSDRFNGFKRCWQNSFPMNPLDRVMGDNILLDGVAHLAMSFKADMLVFTPALPGAESMMDALKRALHQSFTEREDKKTGRLRDYGWESTEVVLISLYDYLITTNDWDFVRQHLPVLQRVVKATFETDTDKDGIFESPYHGNFYEQRKASLNWWDDFAFGHKDAYVNILAYRALRGMREIFSMLELKDDVDGIDKQLTLFKNSFHRVFFNPETGVYCGWVSQDGRMHDYMFTFINGMAINQGLVEKELAKSILEKLLDNMKKEGYDFIYGVPGPTIPVDPKDRGDWEEMTRWGRYENGGLCGQTAYHFIQALYNTGMREQADHILFSMLATFERELTHSGLFPGYGQSVDWRTKGGAPCGYNYLADNYYFLLATVTGHYGIPYPKLRTPDSK
jgi:Glycogen debranching enzyme